MGGSLPADGSRAERAETLALGALSWLVGSARTTATGLTWAATPDADEVDTTLYSGGAGIALALLEAQQHFRDDRYGDTALQAARELEAGVEHHQQWSLYSGLTGTAVALQAVHERLGDEPSGAAARAALDRVRAHLDGQRRGPMFELLGGNAGIALGALSVGDVELALFAVTPYLSSADPTPGGVNWAVRPGPARSHHMAHGTLGIAYALAAVGAATGQHGLIELALAGAADVAARNRSEPDGFLVPHSDPPHRPDLIERYSYGWCNGPAGDAQAFRLLAAVTEDSRWAAVAVEPPEFSRWPATAPPNKVTTSSSPASWSTTSHKGRPSTATACVGPTLNTAQPRARWNPVPAGRWATPASSGSCCASRG